MFLESLKFFKTPRHKQFNYRPLYWNEEKEEFDKRVEATKQEALGQKDYSQESLRQRIDFRAQAKTARRPDFMTNLRVLLIAGLLGLGVYFVYWIL